jgi:hypothetical protein
MGRHSSRRSTPVRFTLRSRPPQLVEWVDLRSGITHLLTTEAVKAGRTGCGRYVAVCGAEVFPSDSTEPIGGCQPCHGSVPIQRSRASRSRQMISPLVSKRVWLTGIVDAETQVEHWVTDRSAAEHRHSGRYLAVCGIQVLAASLTAPASGGRCMVCVGAS